MKAANRSLMLGGSGTPAKLSTPHHHHFQTLPSLLLSHPPFFSFHFVPHIITSFTLSSMSLLPMNLQSVHMSCMPILTSSSIGMAIGGFRRDPPYPLQLGVNLKVGSYLMGRFGIGCVALFMVTLFIFTFTFSYMVTIEHMLQCSAWGTFQGCFSVRAFWRIVFS